ncbi:MAG: hypothetical protein CND43_03535 [Flavobacteriales bacterium MED-G15]|nr:MAG: hypothetical protein CND43_03535 [Flavobacteriales bacterium MED-G15]|tara:strand:+ start:140 stop:1075 length:936 start_codon:yes stop_codon:yes gene_type:complete
MLSRVANNLFWMDRYMERSYGLLNLIKTNYNSTLDSGDYASWNNVLKTFMGVEEAKSNDDYLDTISIINYMLFDLENPNTMVNIVIKARENARSVQEHISRELWLSVNKYYLHITDEKLQSTYQNSDPFEFVNEMLQFNHIYYSVADITQERGNAYCFMNLGKYLERMVQSIEFLSVRIINLDQKSQRLSESFFWKNLLISIGGYQLYVKTYKSIFKVENIIEMIAINENFPRSIRYSVNKLYTHIERLNSFNQLNDKELLFHVGKLKNTLQYTTIDSIKKIGLQQFLEEIKFGLSDISLNVNKIYFSQTY